jgi:hypothetical protein
MKIIHAPLGERASQGVLRKSRTTGRGDGANVDQQLDSGGGELVQELGGGLSLVADREERRRAQSNSSSRKLLRRFL